MTSLTKHVPPDSLSTGLKNGRQWVCGREREREEEKGKGEEKGEEREEEGEEEREQERE